MRRKGEYMFFVKTRNWHCKKWVKALIGISKLWGVKRGDLYEDGDGKYYLETFSEVKAVLTWAYFMALYRFSGGWTYVYHNDKYLLNSDKEYSPTL